MTLEECYSRIGGDYRDVLRRLDREERVVRFLSRFPEEESYPKLCAALEAENPEEAFRAAHSLKGICMNLGLTPLFHSTDALTEELRGGKMTPRTGKLSEQVTQDYSRAVEAIREFVQTSEKS